MSKYIGFLFFFFLFSCSHQQSPSLTADEEQRFLQKGDSISNIMQSVLMKNVSVAIQAGGTDFAIEFCNLNAVPLIDSVSNVHQIQISRVTDKNRNPNNHLQTTEDKLAWKKIKSGEKDVVLQSDAQDIFYYKPIIIRMPTCIQCHGTKEDISLSTKKLIHKKYPDDKAVNYAMGDLRGMWKIKF